MISLKNLLGWEKGKTFILQFAFLIFILLNIVDFLNILQGDLDFFKKLLSWVIIAYVFYYVSFTKLLIGRQVAIYDFLYIIAFSLMSIIKALVLYSHTVYVADKASYIMFSPVLEFVISLPINLFLYSTFLIGFIMTVILSVSLLLNHRPIKPSFIASLGIKDGYFKYVIEQLALIFMTIFFGMILFNLFMEWFALAVDSLLLVLGMFYYFYMNLHDRVKAKGHDYFKSVANTGNEFYQNLLNLFADKRTIFVGISFLLTLHAVVDAGVYLVPYSIGTQSTLYFSDFADIELDNHVPLFNFFDYENSMSYTDLTNAQGDPILSVSILLSYAITLLFFFSFMLLPFYIFYNNVRKVPIRFGKMFASLAIASVMYYLFLVALPGAHPPLIMTSPDLDSSIRGVDIISQSMTQGVNPYELVSLSLLFFVALIFLLYRYDAYEYFFKRILLFSLLVFFLIYIVSFAGNFIHVEYDKLKTDVLELEEHKQVNPIVYGNLIDVYNNDRTYNSIRSLKVNLGEHSFFLSPFSTIRVNGSQILENQTEHHDFMLVTMELDEPTFIQVDELGSVFFKENSMYEIRSNNYILLSRGEIEFIYVLGKDWFDIQRLESGRLRVQTNLDQNTITNAFYFGEPSAQEVLQKIIEYLRLVFTGIFYIFGITAFLFYYLRKNFVEGSSGKPSKSNSNQTDQTPKRVSDPSRGKRKH